MALDLLVVVQLDERLALKVLVVGGNGEVTVNLLQVVQGEVAKVALDVDGTLDGLQGVELELLQLGVVEDTELTVNLGQVVHGEGGQLLVGEDLERRTNFLKVVERNLIETVVGKLERAVDVLQVGDGQVTNILDGQVGGPDQVLKLDSGIVRVEGQGQALGDGLKARQVDGGDVLVVVDVQTTNVVELQKLVDRGDGSVGQGQGGHLSKTRVQVETGERWQGDKGQLLGLLQLVELNSVQLGQSIERQGTGDVAQAGEVNLGDGGRIENVDVTLDGLNLAQLEVSDGITGDFDGTVQSRAGGELQDGRSSQDGGGVGALLGGVCGGGEASQGQNERLKQHGEDEEKEEEGKKKSFRWIWRS